MAAAINGGNANIGAGRTGRAQRCRVLPVGRADIGGRPRLSGLPSRKRQRFSWKATQLWFRTRRPSVAGAPHCSEGGQTPRRSARVDQKLGARGPTPETEMALGGPWRAVQASAGTRGRLGCPARRRAPECLQRPRAEPSRQAPPTLMRQPRDPPGTARRGPGWGQRPSVSLLGCSGQAALQQLPAAQLRAKKAAKRKCRPNAEWPREGWGNGSRRG